jgi:hypothetical protein
MGPKRTLVPLGMFELRAPPSFGSQTLGANRATCECFFDCFQMPAGFLASIITT